MKTARILTIAMIMLMLAGLFAVPGTAVTAQPQRQEVEEKTATPQAVQSIERPIVVIESYYFDQDTIRPGDSFNLYLSVSNSGGQAARNLIFSFSGEEFQPQETGGVRAVYDLDSGGKTTVKQRMLASSSLWGKTSGSAAVNLTYNGPGGEVFTETFTLTIMVLGWSGDWKTPTPTPTATGVARAQLVVTGYRTDMEPLQPGSIFNLEMSLRNLGGGDARNVTMVLGGGATGSSQNAEGTPQPGGVSAGGSDLAVFAPLGSSNIQFLGDIASDTTAKAEQKLIVNVTANPGAYTLKLSFLYSDAKGMRQVDDQIITLLIYQLPQVEVNFYRDPGPISMGMPNMLPIQVVNLGRKPAVFGNMKVTSEGGEVSNNVSLVGPLEPGGYYPLDVNLIPMTPGTVDLKVSINYTDDFNQSRLIEQVLQVNVMEDPGMMGPFGPDGMPLGPDGMPMDPGMMPGEGNFGPPVEETVWDKVVRFFKGLFGLDSGPSQPGGPGGPGEMDPRPIPNPGGKG